MADYDTTDNHPVSPTTVTQNCHAPSRDGHARQSLRAQYLGARLHRPGGVERGAQALPAQAEDSMCARHKSDGVQQPHNQNNKSSSSSSNSREQQQQQQRAAAAESSSSSTTTTNISHRQNIRSRSLSVRCVKRFLNILRTTHLLMFS